MRAWTSSQLPGSYVSADGRYTAELQAAGFYAETGCRLTRHYAIRARGQQAILGRPRTLAEAADMFEVKTS